MISKSPSPAFPENLSSRLWRSLNAGGCLNLVCLCLAGVGSSSFEDSLAELLLFAVTGVSSITSPRVCCVSTVVVVPDCTTSTVLGTPIFDPNVLLGRATQLSVVAGEPFLPYNVPQLCAVVHVLHLMHARWPAALRMRLQIHTHIYKGTWLQSLVSYAVSTRTQ